MTGQQRGIDSAMAADRPAKQVVRGWWVEQVRQRKPGAVSNGVPAYLTLPGAEGLDLQALLDAGVIARTEAGQIDTSDAGLLVAFESDLQAVAAVKKKFPGLDVHPTPIKSALSGSAGDSYPDRKSKRALRAAVVNLDLNGALSVDDQGVIEVLTWVEKFCKVHASNPKGGLSWCLCLTVAAKLEGPPERRNALHDFLREQVRSFGELEDLANQVAPWLMEEGGSDDGLRTQQLLLLLVPAKLAAHVSEGWAITMVRAAAYGHDTDEHAAMVTFVVDLDPSVDSRERPVTAQEQFYATLGPAITWITHDGDLDGPSPLDPVPANDYSASRDEEGGT